MRNLLIIVTFLISGALHAAQVEGSIFYLKPDGEMATRDVTIDVPARGQGEVVLSGNGFEWRSDNFWTVENKGRSIFYVSFQSEFRGQQFTTVFRGTYLRGTNQLRYYGDFYKKSGHEADFKNLSTYKHSGGFEFVYDR